MDKDTRKINETTIMSQKVAMKLVEELNELATVIMQQNNKAYKNLTKDIEDEIADVKVWLSEYEKLFDWNYIDNRIINKRKKHGL
jgi:NTP pyrophosphatase (non-canonical NTP hydrolase)